MKNHWLDSQQNDNHSLRSRAKCAGTDQRKTNMTRRTLQALVAAIFVSSMFIFSLAVSHAEDEKTDDTPGNTYVPSYAVKGSFGTASYVTVAGLASQEECNHLGVERTANPDQKHHPFRVGQYICKPISTRIEDEETTGDIKTRK
jgi:hypothetical protein